MSRTEAFLKYAEEHPSEVLEAIDDKTDALIRELEQKEWGSRRRDPRPTGRPRRPTSFSRAPRRPATSASRSGRFSATCGRT